MLTNEQIFDNKIEISRLLRNTNREGIENIIHYLEESGFYEAPSSTNLHHNWKRGLAENCLGVFKIA